MDLDPRVVVAAFGITWLMSSMLAMAVWWTRRRYLGFGRWAWAGPVLLVSLFLLDLRPAAPERLGMVSANALLALGTILFFEGAREFRGFPPRRWSMYAGAGVAIVSLAFFLYVVPSLNARSTVMSLYLAIVLLLTSTTLLRDVPPGHRFGLRLTGGLFAACGRLTWAEPPTRPSALLRATPSRSRESTAHSSA